MTAGKQEAVNRFIEHHAITHGGSVHGLGIDGVILLLAAGILIVLAAIARARIARIPHGLTCAAEAYVAFIRDHIVYANFGKKEGRRFVSFFCSLFIFIVAGNLVGLIPSLSTPTANISVTAALALIFLSVTLYCSVWLHGFARTTQAFIPGGIPRFLKFPLFCIEVVSLATRTFALAIRLFGNMLAGHILIYSLLGMTVVFGATAFPALALAAAVYGFELFVSLLQAYIFTLLAAIFMNMIVNPEHGAPPSSVNGSSSGNT